MRIAAALLTSLLALSVPASALGQMEPSPSPAPIPVPTASPEPSALPQPDRPILSAPVPRPDGPRPRLKTKRAPDAMVEKRGVRLELWVPRRPVKTGRWLPATVRVTNLRSGPINHRTHFKLPLCYVPVGAGLDIAALLDPGVQQEGRAHRFKQQFLSASAMSRLPLTARARKSPQACSRNIRGGRVVAGDSVTVPLTVFVRYPWADQPLPSGSTTVTAQYRFWKGRTHTGPWIDMEVTAPVRIDGEPVEYASPQQVADAALADAAFRAWVDSRWKNAAFYPNVQGIWPEDGHSLADLGYVGGPAPRDTIEFDTGAGGKTHAWVRTVSIDPWTATVEEVDIVTFLDD